MLKAANLSALAVALIANVVCGAEVAESLPDRFHIASAKTDESLKLGPQDQEGERPPRWKARMVIDGHLTDAAWPEHPPQCWKIGEGLFLLHDSYSGTHATYVWRAAGKTLAPLGYCQPFSLPGVGTIVARRITADDAADRKEDRWEILDFNIMSGEPRVLLTVATPAYAYPYFIGQRDGHPVFFVENSITVMSPGHAPRTKQFDLKQWRIAGAPDAVRGPHVLLLGRNMPEVATSAEPKEFECEAGLLNLDSGAIRKIGMVPGGWTMHTAVPHPYAAIAWMNQEQAAQWKRNIAAIKHFAALGFGPTGHVQEETLTLITPGEVE